MRRIRIATYTLAGLVLVTLAVAVTSLGVVWRDSHRQLVPRVVSFRAAAVAGSVHEPQSVGDVLRSPTALPIMFSGIRRAGVDYDPPVPPASELFDCGRC